MTRPIMGENFTRSLTIDGDTNTAGEVTLKANHSEILGRGNEDYILALRSSILGNRTVGYRVPEMWDREWFHSLGPKWAPDSVSDSTLQCWLKPEQFQEDSGGADFSAANDSSSNEVNFTQSTVGSMPAIGSKGLNNFRPLDYSESGRELYAIAADGTAVFNVNDGTTDFVYGFVVTTSADNNAFQTLFQHGSTTDNGTISVDIKYTSTDTLLRIRTKASGSESLCLSTNNVPVSTSQILICGRKTGSETGFIRVDGTDRSASGSVKAVNSTDDSLLGQGYTGTGGSAQYPFIGSMYEMVMIKESASGDILNDIKKLEGYFAHKYNLTGRLPAAHDYKINSPRATVIK